MLTLHDLSFASNIEIGMLADVFAKSKLINNPAMAIY